jgi:hypothetical protein
MSEPRLYEWYDRQQAIAFFGNEAQAIRLCDGQWLIFPEFVLCLTVIGKPSEASHFASGSDFCWVAEEAYRVHSGRHNHFVPAQVIGTEGERRSIRLFVRPGNAAKYMYVGELAPSYMQRARAAGFYGMARFELRQTLPSAIWLQLGGLQLGDMDAASVDRALDRLREPTTLDERLEVIRRLVEYWHGPIQPEDGWPQAELGAMPLPHPLKWWYGWAGRRKEIMSGQNTLLIPRDPQGYRKLQIEDGLLLFYLENQAVYRWATLPEGHDPPVFGRYETTDAWEPEGVLLSEHLILACIFEAIFCHSPYGAAVSCLDQETLAAIERVVPPIAVNPWRWVGPNRFYARNGVFMNAASNGGDFYSVWIGAKSEGPLQFLKPYLDDRWEYKAV